MTEFKAGNSDNKNKIITKNNYRKNIYRKNC